MDKSILILAVPRTGSTSLLNSFHKNFELFDEPVNLFMRKDFSTKQFFELIKKKNIVVKTMTDHKPFDFEEDSLTFNLKIIPYFDYVILLDRKDCNEQENSYQRIIDSALTHKEVEFKRKSNLIRFMYYQKYLLREISEKSDLKIYYYEDIYYNNPKIIFEELNINLDYIDFNLLDLVNKYNKNIHFIGPKKTI